MRVLKLFSEYVLIWKGQKLFSEVPEGTNLSTQSYTPICLPLHFPFLVTSICWPELHADFLNEHQFLYVWPSLPQTGLSV